MCKRILTRGTLMSVNLRDLFSTLSMLTAYNNFLNQTYLSRFNQTNVSHRGMPKISTEIIWVCGFYSKKRPMSLDVQECNHIFLGSNLNFEAYWAFLLDRTSWTGWVAWIMGWEPYDLSCLGYSTAFNREYKTIFNYSF